MTRGNVCVGGVQIKTWVAFGVMLFALNTAHGATPAKEKVARDYWKETTPLSFVVLKGFLQKEDCTSSLETFMGCTAAINNLAAYDSKRATLTTLRLIANHPKEYGKILMTSGLLAVAEVNRNAKPARPKASFAELRQLEAMRDEERRKSFAEAFESTPAPFDLDAVFDFVAARQEGAEQEAAIAADCINVYYITAIDPHTHISPTLEIAERREGKDESLVGIGATLNKVGNRVVVIAPMENSPALKAGLKANDIIAAVDEVSVDGLEIDAVVSKIRGEAGTLVKLQIERKKRSFTLTIQRDEVKIENVQARMLQDRGTKIGFIRLNQFMSESGCEEISARIQELETAGARGLIFDLRANGGGLLTQALCIGGLFLGPNQVITQVKSLTSGLVRVLRSPASSRATRLPMITLIDGGSASASEIVAGALQDHQRSWIAGSRSYGKATVQSPVTWSIGRIEFDDVTLYRTIERFYQPSGRTNQVVGIIPDFLLDPKPYATEDDRFAMRESDLFKNALPPIGPVWHQERQGAANDVQRCLITTSQATELFEARSEDAIPPDYALLEAQDLMACVL